MLWSSCGGRGLIGLQGQEKGGPRTPQFSGAAIGGEEAVVDSGRQDLGAGSAHSLGFLLLVDYTPQRAAARPAGCGVLEVVVQTPLDGEMGSFGCPVSWAQGKVLGSCSPVWILGSRRGWGGCRPIDLKSDPKLAGRPED